MRGGVMDGKSPATRLPARGRWTISYSPVALATFVAIFGLAFIPVLGSLGALLFLMGGMALVLSRPGETLAALRREWMVVLMALWCLMSFAWSDYPSLTLRYGIQLCLTVAIAGERYQLAFGASTLPRGFISLIARPSPGLDRNSDEPSWP